jgi:hypothetical protein
MAIRQVASRFSSARMSISTYCLDQEITWDEGPIYRPDENARLMLAAEAKTGARHHVAHSIIGSERPNET